jgi:hypothetical protein
MKIPQGNSQYSYLYLKQKCHFFFFFFYKIRIGRQNRSCLGWVEPVGRERMWGKGGGV